MLSWAKPCSALWDLRVVCIFLKEKVPLFGCSPRTSCYLVQGAGGSCLEIALILYWNVPEHVSGFFIKKNPDIARSGFFLSWILEVVLSWRSLLGDVRFFRRKKALTECSPRASCYLEQGARGSCLKIALILRWNVPERVPGFFIKKNSDIARSGFFLSWFVEVVLPWRSLLGDVHFFKEKSALLSVAPESLAIWNKELEGLESYVVLKLLTWRSLSSDVHFFEH